MIELVPYSYCCKKSDLIETIRRHAKINCVIVGKEDIRSALISLLRHKKFEYLRVDSCESFEIRGDQVVFRILAMVYTNGRQNGFLQELREFEDLFEGRLKSDIEGSWMLRADKRLLVRL